VAGNLKVVVLLGVYFFAVVVEPHSGLARNQVELIVALVLLQATEELAVAEARGAARISKLPAIRLGVVASIVNSEQAKAVVERLLGVLRVDGEERRNVRLHELVLLLAKGQGKVVLREALNHELNHLLLGGAGVDGGSHLDGPGHGLRARALSLAGLGLGRCGLGGGRG
jgi:hypothetical protein